MTRRWQKGSFAIEAAFIIPFILIFMFQILLLGIGFFQESKMRVPYYKLQEIDAVQYFYEVQKLKDFAEDNIRDGA